MEIRKFETVAQAEEAANELEGVPFKLCPLNGSETVAGKFTPKRLWCVEVRQSGKPAYLLEDGSIGAPEGGS